MSDLGDLLSLEYGEPLPSEIRTGHGYPVFGSNGEVGRHDSLLIEGPGIIVGRKGSAGKVCWTDESFWPIDTTYWVKCESGDQRWLYWLLSHLPLSRLGSSTGVPGLNRDDAYTLQVFEPPGNERRKIAMVLDTLETSIRQTEAIIEKLKLVKQGLLHDLLTRGIDANGELRPSQTHAPHLYKDSPLGWIPVEWEVLPLCELGDVLRGKFTHRPRNDPAFYGGAFPFIQTGDVAQAAGGYLTEFSQTLSERGAAVSQEFPAGTIAITIAANIADTAILSIPMYFPDSVVGMIVSHAINVQFVELSIRRAKPKLDARAPQSAQKNINLQDLRPLLIAVPHKHEQDEIASRAEAIQLRIQAEEKFVDKLMREKTGLMDDLLTGRVCVTPLLETLGT
ncbi:restriction endonuclease subunit S [Janthinobacterium lividum]|uniref:restriction endonuclease subunit S n=1 Tax=Janthinobacterium lividum TaxID=29581 RepID=UPI001408C7F2|nr:restriction endonuclease subunit S [Janthinobacterium lividum]NHQ93956.1 restriction endonuclease subunit S [Janthinobacterium lividum]